MHFHIFQHQILQRKGLKKGIFFVYHSNYSTRVYTVILDCSHYLIFFITKKKKKGLERMILTVTISSNRNPILVLFKQIVKYTPLLTTYYKDWPYFFLASYITRGNGGKIASSSRDIFPSNKWKMEPVNF